MLQPGKNSGDPQVHSFLVALPRGLDVPHRIAGITGISGEMLSGAMEPDELARLIAPVLGVTLPVAHFAAFEKRWIRRLMEDSLPGTSVPRFICTRELARRLYPRLPRKGIRALAGFMGLHMGEFRRAADHVKASVHIWRTIMSDLHDRGIITLGQLEEFLQLPVPKSTGPFEYALSREERLNLPDNPGVYRLLSRNGDVLYVGKARSLRSRVNSYFTRRKGTERLLELVSQVHGVDVEECATPLEAAMMEVAEIGHHDPPYNVALRGRGERLCFLAPDLATESAEPGDGPVWGPLPVSSPAMFLGNLLNAIISGAQLQPEDLGLCYCPLEPGSLEEGVHLLREQFSERPLQSVSDILRAGSELWLAGSGETAEAEEDSDEDEEQSGEIRQPAEQLDSEGVRKHLEWVLCHGVRDLRRSAWFRLLGWSAIVWTPGTGGGCRAVSISAGRIVEASWVSGKASPPAIHSPSPGRILREFDCRVFRRLRVLDSEVRRIVAEGVLGCVCVPGGRVLGEREIETLYVHI